MFKSVLLSILCILCFFITCSYTAPIRYAVGSGSSGDSGGDSGGSGVSTSTRSTTLTSSTKTTSTKTTPDYDNDPRYPPKKKPYEESPQDFTPIYYIVGILIGPCFVFYVLKLIAFSPVILKDTINYCRVKKDECFHSRRHIPISPSQDSSINLAPISNDPIMYGVTSYLNQLVVTETNIDIDIDIVDETDKVVYSLDDDNCCICLDLLSREALGLIETLKCNHKFHDKCIQEWKMHGNGCPLCRKVLT